MHVDRCGVSWSCGSVENIQFGPSHLGSDGTMIPSSRAYPYYPDPLLYKCAPCSSPKPNTKSRQTYTPEFLDL
jgi:hypothetical protein